MIKVQIQVSNLASRALLDPASWPSQPRLSQSSSCLAQAVCSSSLNLPSILPHASFTPFACIPLFPICLHPFSSIIPTCLSSPTWKFSNTFLTPPQTSKSWGAPPLCSHSILNFPPMICIRLPWHCPSPSLPSHLDQKTGAGICLAVLIVVSQDNQPRA